MQPNNLLKEVVVVAYGTQKKEAIVGSVSVLTNDIIEKQQVISVTNALQGTVSGVSVISSGGQPGDNPTIRIRGIGSINASSSPLIILDGTPYNGNINSISYDQIESLSVLKDASSTALYGSRAANGVILISTKKGVLNSSTKITFRSSVGIANLAVTPHKLLSTDDQFLLSWEAIKNANVFVDKKKPEEAALIATNNLTTSFGYNPYGPTVPNPVDINGKLVSTNKLWDTNWRNLLFNNAALRQEHGLTVSSGRENSSYFFSVNYLNQEGSITRSKFERITTRLNYSSKLKRWLELGFSTSYSNSYQKNPIQSGNNFQAATAWTTKVSSAYPLYRRDENGNLVLDNLGNKIFDYGATAGQSINGQRPILNNENAYGALFNHKIINKRDNLQTNGYLKFNLANNLSFKSTLGYEKAILDGYQYFHNEFGEASTVGGRVTQRRNFFSTLNIVNTLSYTKSINNNNIDITLINEAYTFKADELIAQGTGFLPNVQVLNGSTTPEGVGGFVNEERLEGYLARVSYNYDNRYFIEGSYRKDGSTKFAELVRWGNFYSVGGSWIISKESFLQRNSTINYLKLKGSYGELGNNRGIGNFPYLFLFETGFNELTNTGVVLGGVTEPLLSWEKTSLFNIGLDFGLFNNKINGIVEYYNKKSIDLIYDKPLPGSTGSTSIKSNVGSIGNSGIDINLQSINIASDDFEWSSNLILSFVKNKILELTQDSFISGTKRWEVGTSLYEFFLREYAGVDPATGEALWYTDEVDQNGNPTGNKVTTNDYSKSTRYQTGKESLPNFTGGLTNTFRYKNFDLNILANFSFGGYIYDSTYASLMEGFKRPGTATSVDIVNRWQKPGDVTDIPRLLNRNNDYNSTSDRFLFKNDFIRLKAFTLGYLLPTDIIQRAGLSKVRFYFQGDNLFTYQTHKGIDPEQNIAGTTNNRSFNQRIYSFGINLEL
ncbi:MAG: SusC/RagA family TonB-linked outer membrane protein [Tenacibaculum sp.]